MKIRKFVIVMFLLPLFFSLGYAGSNTKSSNQSSKIEKNNKLSIEQNKTSADIAKTSKTSNTDDWWDDSDLDISDVKKVKAANQAATAANQAATAANKAEWNWKDIKAANQAATKKLKQINNIALWH